jgi:hypothetical protein
MSDTEKNEIQKFIASLPEGKEKTALRKQYFPSEQDKAIKDNFNYINRIK